MIQVIEGPQRNEFTEKLTAHYRIRHDIYVSERRWMDLAKSDGLERDQFDNDDAIYVLLEENGQVIGGSRLMPSEKPHLLSEVFPHLVTTASLPRGPNIYEWTRVHVVKERREGRNGGRPLGTIICGILEYCLDHHIDTLTALVEMWWFPRFHAMGFVLKPLGLPELIEDEWSAAVSMPVTYKTLIATRSHFGVSGPVLGATLAETA